MSTWRQEMMPGRVLFPGLLIMAAQPVFLIEPRTSPGMIPPTMAWVLHHQSLIKTTLYRLAYSSVLWSIFSTGVLSSQMALASVKLDKIRQHTESLINSV